MSPELAVTPMATSRNIYKAPFWKNNSDEPSKPFLMSYSCPPLVMGPEEVADEAEICFPVSCDWQNVLTSS